VFLPFFISLGLLVAPSARAAVQGRLCLNSTIYNLYGNWYQSGDACTAGGLDSKGVWLGDDTGYREQELNFVFFNPNGTMVCINHKALGTRGWNESGWQCSSNGAIRTIHLGDDTGWKDQQLRIYTDGPEEVCLHHSRRSNSTNKVVETSLCSSNSKSSQWTVIGDDTGWLDQTLWADIHR
jgi:hypothetical protein